MQLSDEHLRELYSSFMLIYVEEYDEAVLERLGIGARPLGGIPRPRRTPAPTALLLLPSSPQASPTRRRWGSRR